MELLILLEQTEAILKLTQNSRTIDPAPFEQQPQGGLASKPLLKRCGVDSEKFSYYHDLDDQLITHIDKLLERNSIDITAIKDYKIEGNVGEDATSRKIAEAFIEGLKIKV